jgi:glycerol-3-phosphate dehydrogenase
VKREQMVRMVREHAGPWDIAIIGGGATGMGVAVDAAARGFSVVLFEAHDFGKGTSSRSTKLVHGGVRYLEQGNIPLVMSALKERGLMRQNAPHLVHDLAFVVPNYSWWEAPFYGIGLKLYDMLAGKYGFGKSRILSTEDTLALLPTLERNGLRGGVTYYDGQFDDSRLLIHLAMTAADHGATLLNYMPAIRLTKDEEGYLNGAVARDGESGEEFTISAQVVINATGIFTDRIRKLADPEAAEMITPSQGIHLVFDRSFLRGDVALMVPRTSDGRVLFAIPWHNHTVVGTTDTPLEEPAYEPVPLEQEIEFVLETAGLYLSRPPKRSDVLSVYAGIRPLVKADGENKTSALSRDHVIHVDNSGLLTLTGGKWTTYRHMAEDCVDHAITLGRLRDEPCVTKTLHIHGYREEVEDLGSLWVYGADAAEVQAIGEADPALREPLHPSLPCTGAEVLWAARAEMARNVEDVLARRNRALFLDARAAIAMAEPSARIMAKELGHGDDWAAQQVASFTQLAQQYLVM